MRHGKKRFQLNRFTSWRSATITSLAKNLLIHQSIKTTRQRAYAVRPLIDKLVTLGKSDSLAARRQAYRILSDHKLVNLLFSDIAPRFTNRIGGYSRVLLLGARRGDNAQGAVLELTEIKKEEPRKAVKKEKEAKPETETQKEIKPEIAKEKPVEEKKPKITEAAVKEKPPISKKPVKKFLGGLRGIFKKERDSL